MRDDLPKLLELEDETVSIPFQRRQILPNPLGPNTSPTMRVSVLGKYLIERGDGALQRSPSDSVTLEVLGLESEVGGKVILDDARDL